MRVREAFQRAAIRVVLSYERLRTGSVYDPYDPRYLSDPYPLFAILRERDPVHRSSLVRGWVFTRYADVAEILGDRRFSADQRSSRDYPRILERMRRAGLVEPDREPPVTMLRSDPPDHDRLRALVSRAFTPRSVRALRPRIEAVVREQLDSVATQGHMDVIRDLAYPLPVIVIAEMIGVPPEDRDRFKHWSDEVVLSLGFATLEQARRSNQASRELKAYFAGIAEQRRREPREDLMSGLLAAEEAGDRLTADEIFEICLLILVAGHETTTKLIGNGVLALLRHPDQLLQLQREPARIESAVEEMLRYDGPVQATSRFVKDDMELAGRKLRKGEEVLILLASANRDPERFGDPDTFDISRADNSHVAFGHGIHFCLGANLARLETQVAVAAMVERMPRMKLAADRLEWGQNLILRGLVSLPVTF